MNDQHFSQLVSDLAPCSCGSEPSGSLVPVSRYAFQRRVRRRFYSWSPAPGVRIYFLSCGCSLWVHSTGERFVCSLPF